MLKVKNITFLYKEQPSPKPMSFEVRPQSANILIGPNGCGKTSLLRALIGLTPIISGTVESKTKTPAYLSTNPQLNEHLSGQDILQLFDIDSSPWNIQEAHELFDIKPLLFRSAHTLSHGELKRLLWVAVLSHPSPLVLLDEPLNGLDWQYQLNSSYVVQEQIKQGRSFLISTHDLQWPLRLGNPQALSLSEGGLITNGPYDQLITSTIVQNSFNFISTISDNPIDGTRTLTLSKSKK